MRVVTSAAPIIAVLKGVETVIFDVETSGLRPWRDGKILAGLGIKPLDGEAFYIPFRHGLPGARQAELTAKLNEDLTEAKISLGYKLAKKRSVIRVEAEIEDLQAKLDLVSVVEDNAPFEELHLLGEALRGKTLVGHNPKFDLAVLYQDGLDLSQERVLDTIVTTRLVYEAEVSYALKNLEVKLLGWDAGKNAETELKKYLRFLRGPKRKKDEEETKEEDDLNYAWATPSRISSYVELDLRGTEELLKLTLPLIEKRGLNDLFELEQRLTRVLFGMERRGFLVDRAYCLEERTNVQTVLDSLQQQADELIGRPLDIRKTADIKVAFEEQLGLTSPRKTPRGADSWDKVALASFEHPLAEVIVKYRAVQNIKNYYDTYVELMDPQHRVHGSFQQAGAKTGRCSCRTPNFQNIPRFEGFTGSKVGAQASMVKRKRKEEAEALEKKKRYEEAGKRQLAFDEETAAELTSEFEGLMFGKVRGAFIPEPDSFLLIIDWSQIELRVFADYANERELLQAFDIGLDVHAIAATAAFGKMPEDKDSQMYKWVRNMGKQIAFGLLYGMGVSLLSVEIGKSKEEAQKFMDRYFARFKNAKRFIDTVHQTIITRAASSNDGLGWVKNRWGRRRYIPEGQAYKGVNFLIQGTSADLLKDALVRLDAVLLPYGTKIINCVHDEIQFNVLYTEVEQVVPLIVSEMTTCSRVNAKLKVDIEWSPTRWSEKTSLDCDACEGYGHLVELPGVSETKVKDVLLVALSENNQEILDSARMLPCGVCNETGYDLSKITKPVDIVA